MKRMKKTSQSRKTAAVPSFAEVARLIVPIDTPPWLARHFENWGASLMLDRAVQQNQPTKAEMRKRLLKIRDAAALLLRALNDTATLEFLEIAGAIRVENLGGLEHTLRMIAQRADIAAASPAVATKTGKTKSGRGKALPSGAMSPKTYCAFMIAETWKYFHGRYPGPRNPKAAAAARAFWLATGGATPGWGDGLNGWRQPFTIANSAVAQELRAKYCRHLHLSERHSGPGAPPGK